MKISLAAQKEIRSFTIRNGKGYTYAAAPIVVVEGKSHPTWRGTSGSYETKTGKPVYYPNAYRRAWGKPIYVHSTRRIEVGKQWLRQLEIDLIQVQCSKQRGKFVAKELAEFIFNFGSV